MRAAVCLFLAGAVMLQAQQPASQQPAPALPEGYMPLAFTPHGSAPSMKVQELGPASRTFKITLRKGDEIISALLEFAQKNHVREAHFSGIGAIDSGLGLAGTTWKKRLIGKLFLMAKPRSFP